MASSKTHPLSKKKQVLADASRPTCIAVAFSGGLDSTALVHAAVAAHGSENVMALHVHHGLQKQADQWLLHCAQIAQKLEVAFDYRVLDLGQGQFYISNLEAKAREGRYRALGEMCRAHNLTNLLLAHHQDDQAETVILQLLRGAGLGGLSAMPMVREDKNFPLRLWRPFIELTRAEIEAYAQEYSLEWIEDPSNTDERFMRNAVRRRVIPLLEKLQPQVRQNLSRSAAHLAQAKELLDDLADIDLNGMVVGEGIQIAQLMNLRYESLARASNALRRWLSLRSLAMPSEERLNAWWTDLESSFKKIHTELEWIHDGYRLRLWRGILTKVEQQTGYWAFEEIDEQSDRPGLSKSVYVQAQKDFLIQERFRIGGEKMRIDSKRPRRTLKNLYQERDIPPWAREAPLIYLGDDILAVAGVGMNADLMTTSGPRVLVHWLQTR